MFWKQAVTIAQVIKVHSLALRPYPFGLQASEKLTLAQNQCSAKSEIFVFPETSDEFSRSHVI
ncbi:hypothetical protein DXT85_07585 [Klebsiella pneumoniae]|nr:hypothetical protein DXT78_07965 [Klebsiella pneumoniae]TNO35194.1 hypothetical protein DXT85_07585 [Klebsiella pneumoniae]HBZ3116116.1 hypothetical protein [Klebsiella pneumoniae]